MSRLKSFLSPTTPWLGSAATPWLWMLTAFATTLLLSTAAQAALPTVQAVGGAANGDYMTQIRDYIGLIIGLVALVITGGAFLTVAGGSVSKFHEWRAGKAELGDFKMVIMVGALLLVIVVFIVTQAVGVIATSATFAGAGG